MKLLDNIFLEINQEKISNELLQKNAGLSFKSEKSALSKPFPLDKFRSESANIKIESRDVLKDKYSDKTYVVGYTVRNLSSEQIPNIFIGDRVVSLAPGKSLSLPTKWFALFMAKICFGYKATNGEVIIPNSEQENDLDGNFSNAEVVADNLDEQVVGFIDLMTGKIEITNKSYNEYRKSKINIMVDANKICRSAKLIAYMLAA